MLDTLGDIANSMNAALRSLGFPTHPTELYRTLVGEGTEHLIRCILPKDQVNDQTIGKCMAINRAEYARRWPENTKPYDGIGELLSALEERNIPKVVLSNKPDEFTQVIVKKILSDWSFEIIRGVGASVPEKPDPTGALQIAAELSIPPHEFIYLGDTKTDMQTANAARMYAVGALWGFRTAEELNANGAKVLVEKPEDVLKLLIT